jgi:hypothetical protein
VVPRLRTEVLHEDSMEDLVVLVRSPYTVLQKREHRQVHNAERATGQEVAPLQERLEAVQ